MEKPKEQKNINIKIERIKEISFLCGELREDIVSKFNENNITFGIGVRLLPNSPNKEFGIALMVKYIYLNEAEKEELCSYEMECVFKIMEYDDIVRFDGKKVFIEDSLLSNLVSITIGSIRGMLALKTAGTVLNKYPLPIINPLDLLKQMKGQGAEAIEPKIK